MKYTLAIIAAFLFLSAHAQDKVDTKRSNDSTAIDNQVFTNDEGPAMPVGGNEEFYHYIGKNVRYP